MSEGISYIAGAELPCVLMNVMRGGPGLGGILPSQSDYFQATRGGGHGDYRLLVLAPSTVQEAVDLTMLAFDLAEKYRNPVMILADGFMGQMMEAVEFKESHAEGQPDPAEWAVGYMKERGSRALIKSLYLDPEELEAHNWKLQAKYAEMTKNEKRHETYLVEDAEILIAAYGTVARIARTAINELRADGVKVGLFRPISLFPFPYEPLETLPKSIKQILTVEMSCGQMIEDVRLAVGKELPVSMYGRVGGMTPSVEEIKDQVRKALGR
jgi:2-oxoglutarate ferredoxin oxidoreductase subunit alpha